MNLKNIVSFLFPFLLLFQCIKAQIIIKELADKNENFHDSLFLGISRTRTVINLDGKWEVYQPDEPEKKTTVYVPSNFSGEDVLVYEKSLDLDPNIILNRHLRVIFLGINYSAEIILNSLVIYKHPGGDFPIQIDLPKDILKTSGKNILAVKVFHQLSSNETIPVKQRFLFASNIGGIFRDVFLLITPNVFVSSYDMKYNVSNSGKITLNIEPKITNLSPAIRSDSLSISNLYACRYQLLSSNREDKLNSFSSSFNILPKKEKTLSASFEINNIKLWSPQNPDAYSLVIQILQNNELIDELIKPVSFYTLSVSKESLLLNGNIFTLNGTTYYDDYPNTGNLASFEQMKKDIETIKSVGFNAIRFEKGIPHPYLLKLCDEIGLFVFIELPLNSIPMQICWNKHFQARARNFLNSLIKSYNNYSAVAGIGLGSSYIPESSEQIAFIKELGDLTKKNYNKITYASFIGYSIPSIENIDFYGIELYNLQNESYKTKIEALEQQMGKGRLFISEATYATYNGSTNGYLNPFSFEAQAKFFSDIMDFSIDDNKPGYFLNSIFDYKGDYSSLTAGFDKQNIYKIGILGENRELNRISQKVIYSKLHNTEKVTIPIGNKKDDAPMIFILFGMVLAILLIFTINSRRKFREDATRALLRPYNFFSDVRDQRILTGFHSNFLMLMLSATSALLLSNLLFYFRENILLEKIVLAFGLPSLSRWIAYLAWDPIQSLIWLTILSAAFFIITTLMVTIASFFVRNKVYFSSAYFTVTWSFLPLILLLPLGLILYRILNAEFVTIYLLIALIIFTIWIYYRLMKGIYVIFDISAGTVYFYSLVLVLVVVGGILLYFQISNSTVYYIMNAFKQYSLM